MSRKDWKDSGGYEKYLERMKSKRSIKSINEWRFEKECKCGNRFIPKTKNQKYCSFDCREYKKDLNKRNHISRKKYQNKDPERFKRVKREGYFRRNKENPIRAKASRLGTKLGWGKGSTDRLEKIFIEALKSPCYWCGKDLTVKSLSVDHKIPLSHSKFKNGDYTKEELNTLNSQDNIRIICKSCNLMKSSIPEDKFKKLLDWLKQDKELEILVLQRLRTSNLMWFNRK